MNLLALVESQRNFYREGKTRDLDFRLEQLKKLKVILKENEEKINKAVREDFGKSPYEMFITELGLIYNEISKSSKHLKRWSRRKLKMVNLVNQPAWTKIYAEPYGNTLVIGAWNYPVQLSVLPAVSALAAGNTVIIKPGEHAKNVTRVLAEIINPNFPEGLICVVNGGIPETSLLLDQKFDKIFFTGSQAVGQIVMKAAAKYLTPVVLELGGKSPAIILPDAKIERTVQRIIWGKFLNAGQTCVAPDYLLVHKSIETRVLQELKKQIEEYFPEDLSEYEGFARIINDRHFTRINDLIEPGKVFTGGVSDREKLLIRPTVLSDCSFNDPVMQDEIFGPVLPVIAYENLNDTIDALKEKAKPLALYIFGKDRESRKQIIQELSFGGGMVNEVVMHFGNDKMAFGGIGESGMGTYHGKAGFDVFTHYKSVQFKPLWFEPFIKYAPYTGIKWKLVRLILR